MHFLARRGTDLGDLPEATMGQKSDLMHGMGTGLVSGAATGAVIGLIAYLYPELGASLGVGVIFVLALLGACFGVWAAGMVATSVPNTKLKAFDADIEAGHILLMVDVPKERVDEIGEIIRRRHPEAEDHGVEPTIPAFP